MTSQQASHQARDLAARFIQQLTAFRASIGAAVPYGCKLLVSRTTGERLGHLLIYAGKKGPKLVTTELLAATPEDLRHLHEAWHRTTGAPMPAVTEGQAAPDPDAVELWVDGACLQHAAGLQFGWAFAVRQGSVVLHTEHGHTIPQEAVPHRNVGAELEATLRGLAWCAERGFGHVIVYHDYAGIAAWVTGRWRAKTRMTQAYADRVHALKLSITWRHVKGHSGVEMNELVDRLATGSARQSRIYPIP